MFQIPEDRLPQFMKDEQRINVLFAPLRNRSVNPKDWDSKISSWKEIIQIYCDANDIYCFTLSSLNNVFVRNGRPPSCLNEVVTDLFNNNKIQILEVFLRQPSNTWSSWVSDTLVKRPLSWSYNKIKNSVFTVDISNQNFVHLEVIKSKSDNLLKSIPDNYKNRLISLKELLMVLDKNSTDVDNIKLLLQNLSKQQQIDVARLVSKEKEELEKFLIKFRDGNKATQISDVDIGLYTLEQNEKVISKNIEELEDQIEFCIKEAKSHLSKNHRQLAKSALRKKHELEKRVEKKAATLHNVQILLEQIRETHSDARVWDTYKNALSAFNTSFKDTGISEDAIEDTMLQIGDMLDKHEDIQSALSRPVQVTNDSDLEEELLELINEPVEKEADAVVNISGLDEDLEKLTIKSPDVPADSPNVSQEVSATNIQ